LGGMKTDDVAMTVAPICNLSARTAQDKADWVRRFRESGQSLRSFSAQHALPRMSLWRWANKQSAVAGQPNRRHTPQPVPWTEPEFAEIKLETCLERGAWAAELSLPSGRVLRLSKEVPAGMLEQLLRLC